MNAIPKKILVNAITLDSANLAPLFVRLKYWKEQGMEITIFGNKYLKKKLEDQNLLAGYDYFMFEGRCVGQKDFTRLKNKFHFALECLKRNFIALFYIGKLKNKYDVVYSLSSVLDLTILPWFLKRADKKIKWAAVFDNTVSSRQVLSWIFFLISLRFLRKADVIFTIDENLANFLARSGITGEKIVVRENGLEEDLIRRARNSNTYQSDALFVGRINEAKGIFDMLQALKIVARAFPKFQLAVVGDGDNLTKHKFRKKISELGLAGNVKILGSRTGREKFNIIKSAKYFWFLSHGESFGIALLEAVASGLPAFAYDLPELVRLYPNGEVNFSKKGDWRSVAQKTIELFGKNSFTNIVREDLLEKYSWKKVARIEFEAINKM